METPPGGMPLGDHEMGMGAGSGFLQPEPSLMTLAIPQEGGFTSRWDHLSHHPVSTPWARCGHNICEKAAPTPPSLRKTQHQEGGELQGQDALLKHHLHSQSLNPHPLALPAPASPEFD